MMNSLEIRNLGNEPISMVMKVIFGLKKSRIDDSVR